MHERKAGDELHPEHEPLAVLEATRDVMGVEVFSAQYQQAPVPAGGAMIKREWPQYYDHPPSSGPGTKILQSWDTASKVASHNSYSVCTTWMVVNRTDYYLLDVTIGRYDYPTLRDKVMALAEKYKPHTILVEDASTGASLIQELKKLGRHVVRAVPVEHNKIERYLQQAKFKDGQVHFPRRAAWLAKVEDELFSFPQSENDDIVDSITQALAFKIGGYDTTLSWVNGEEEEAPKPPPTKPYDGEPIDEAPKQSRERVSRDRAYDGDPIDDVLPKPQRRKF